MTDATEHRVAKIHDCELRLRTVCVAVDPFIAHGRLIPIHIETELRAIIDELRKLREDAP